MTRSYVCSSQKAPGQHRDVGWRENERKMGENVERFVAELEHHWRARPFVWGTSLERSNLPLAPPSTATVVALAPHPDDPESAAVTCDILRSSGCDIAYSIVCLSPDGVEDRYVEGKGGSELRSIKASIRRAEQESAAKAFGLARESLTFLGIDEREGLMDAASEASLRAHLDEIGPDVVILPIGRDTNETHRWVASVFRRWAKERTHQKQTSVVALYNEDPKTTALRDDLFVVFDERKASWKRRMLRYHDTQQQRNLRTRSLGFDERILGVNRGGYERLPEGLRSRVDPSRYAEVFELEVFGAHRHRGEESHEPQS